MRPYDGADAIGVDRWLERDDPEDTAQPVRYRCLDCSYEPRNGLTAYRHHVGQRPHHRVVLLTGELAQFSCCKAQGAGR
jgi:hypothetical protein